MNNPPVKITPELVIDTTLRRRWLIIVPLALALVVGIYTALTTPKTYEARTFILVEPQRVPEAFVRSIVTADPGERIGTLAQQILSRSNLEKIINDFRLFSDPSQAGMFMEDKINSLRNQINIEVVRDRRGGGGDAFSISFQGKDPEMITRVTNGLAASFINANLMVRESHALGTSEFLDAELEGMRGRLEELETHLEHYRRTYMGELPEQLDTNLRILDRLQNTLAIRQQSLREARIRLGDLTNYASMRNPSVVVIGGDRQNAGASLQELKDQLDSLRSRYTERHPDIQRVVRMIEDLEAREAERLAADDGSQSPVAQVPIELRAQVNEIQREIQTLERDISDLQVQIATHEQRIENTPKREQELLGLRRDYENVRSSYNSLLGRKIESDIAVNMERKQKGEQFRIVDRAQVPQRPIAPDMQKMFMITMAIGLGLGGGLAFLFEFIIRPSFRKPHELESALELPVITSIPLIMDQRQITMKWCNNAASIAVGAITLGLLGVFGVIVLSGTEPVTELLSKVSINL